MRKNIQKNKNDWNRLKEKNKKIEKKLRNQQEKQML